MKKKVFSKILTVLIIFLALICCVLFFKILTKSEVNLFGFRFYYVLTDSMSPTIEPYSIMVVKATPADKLQKGDIISFTSRDPSIYGYVNTHRIYQVIQVNGDRAFVTMGDHNPVPDDYYVYPDEIKGKVVLWSPPVKWLTGFFEFAGTKMGFFIIILIPLMIILAMIMRSFVKEFKASLVKEEKLVEELYAGQNNAVNKNVVVNNKDSNNSNIVNSTTNNKMLSIAEMDSKQAAILILEKFFGKPLDQITVDDIEAKLAELN